MVFSTTSQGLDLPQVSRPLRLPPMMARKYLLQREYQLPNFQANRMSKDTISTTYLTGHGVRTALKPAEQTHLIVAAAAAQEDPYRSSVQTTASSSRLTKTPVLVLVGKSYPSQAVFASACDAKGPEEPVTLRLADFIKASGVHKLVYKSNQEPAIKATVEAALTRIGRSGDGKEGDDFLKLVPEYSAVGDSPSNGRAERAIQTVEDMVRTYIHALEDRINKKVNTHWPVVRWVIEHAACMINRFTTNPDGQSPYASLHGKNPSDRQVEFGEQVFYHVPKRSRSKLDLRWRLGTYLGTSLTSNECFVANVDGEVMKVSSVARVVAESLWSAKAIEVVKGLPGKFVTAHAEGPDGQHIEALPEPHADGDAGERRALDAEEAPKKKRDEADVRITMRDLNMSGFHPGICLRCRDLENGMMNSWHRHSEECRWRIYRVYRDNGDPKFRKVQHLFDDTKDGQNSQPAEAAPPTPTNEVSPDQRAASSNRPPAQPSTPNFDLDDGDNKPLRNNSDGMVWLRKRVTGIRRITEKRASLRWTQTTPESTASCQIATSKVMRPWVTMSLIATWLMLCSTLVSLKKTPLCS